VSRRRGAKRRPATTAGGKKPVSKAAPASRTKAAADAAPAAVSGRPPKPRRWVPWFMAGASYAGFAISLYLTFVHYRGYVSPCYVVHGCEQVQTSRFSTIGPIPLALLGTVFFGLMFYLAIGLLTRSSVTLVRVYKVLAYLAALGVIPLFLIQAIWLRAFCSYCVATEAIMLSMWIVSFLLTPAEQRRAPRAAAAPAGR
jgi:uncharacterized membrane protein